MYVYCRYELSYVLLQGTGVSLGEAIACHTGSMRFRDFTPPYLLSSSDIQVSFRFFTYSTRYSNQSHVYSEMNKIPAMMIRARWVVVWVGGQRHP